MDVKGLNHAVRDYGEAPSEVERLTNDLSRSREGYDRIYAQKHTLQSQLTAAKD